MGKSEIYLDLETLRLSHEVPGRWSNIREFGLAVAVTRDLEREFRHWFEPEAKPLVVELATFARIITFNGNRFDFEVLSHYAPVKKLYERSLDLHADLEAKLGHRVKLEELARGTLGVAKSGSGTKAVEWWRAGQKEKVLKYCEQDVQLLVDLVAFARKNGYVVVDSQHVGVNWG